MSDERARRANPGFPETRWTLVRRAAGDNEPARRALEELCRDYWSPLNAFIRHSGCLADDADDVTQEFIAHLLARKTFAGLSRDGGRLRSFLLAALRNFMIDRARRASALKRGGNLEAVSIEQSEETGPDLLFDEETPRRSFERQWALSVVEAAFDRIERDYRAKERTDLYRALRPFLQGEKESRTYAELGGQLGMREGTVRVAVHRLRQQYRRHFEEVLLETVESPEDLPGEIAFVRQALGS